MVIEYFGPPDDEWQGWRRFGVAWVRPSPDWRPSAENARAAYEVLDRIDADPKSWVQGTWWCNTGGCFAGHRVVMSGEKLRTVDSSGHLVEIIYRTEAGAEIADRAAQLLGFPTADALDDYTWDEDGAILSGTLFSGSNDRRDLGRYVEAIFGPRPADMPVPDAAH